MRPDQLLDKVGPGRPKKYGRPSRAVTLTLPEDVLARLRAMDADVGRAIVTLVERRANGHVPAVRAVEIASYGKHAVIVVTPVRALRRIPGVQLVPTGGGRALISLDHSGSVPQLELDLRDAITKPMPAGERSVLQAVADLLKRARAVRSIHVEQRTIIVLESKRSRRVS